MIPIHIRRKGNAAADYLANWGCKNPNRSIEARPIDAIWDVELYSLQLIVNKYLQRDPNQRSPDRGGQLAQDV